jgi:hypothetical protein
MKFLAVLAGVLALLPIPFAQAGDLHFGGGGQVDMGGDRFNPQLVLR